MFSYYQQIVEFILQNTGQKDFSDDPTFRNPYTSCKYNTFFSTDLTIRNLSWGSYSYWLLFFSMINILCISLQGVHVYLDSHLMLLLRTCLNYLVFLCCCTIGILFHRCGPLILSFLYNEWLIFLWRKKVLFLVVVLG